MSKADKSHIVKVSDEGNLEVVYCPCREDQYSWHECEKCTEEEKRKLGNEYERSGYYNHDELHIMSEWCGGYATETNIFSTQKDNARRVTPGWWNLIGKTEVYSWMTINLSRLTMKRR